MPTLFQSNEVRNEPLIERLKPLIITVAAFAVVALCAMWMYHKL